MSRWEVKGQESEGRGHSGGNRMDALSHGGWAELQRTVTAHCCVAPGQDPAAWASPCALSTGGRWAVCPCVLLLSEAVKAATGSHLRRQGPVSDHWLYWPRLRGCGEGRAAPGGSQSRWAPGL